MIDNRKYTVEAQALVEGWFDNLLAKNLNLSDLAGEIEKALAAAHRNGFAHGLLQRESEAAALPRRDVWLVDPAGAGHTQIGDMIVVHPLKIRVIGTVEVNKQKFDPGELIYCTQAALDKLGDEGVVKALIPHLLGNWSNDDEKSREENDQEAARGGMIYNVLPGDVRIITHCGDHTALILSEEY